MAFQTQVNKYRAVGVAGQAATPDQSVYTAKNYLSDGTAKIGAFAFINADDAGKAGISGDGTVLGLVERTITFPIYDVSKTALDEVPLGYGLTIAVRGDYYVDVSGAASVGDTVYASSTDGTITCGSGDVETPWKVKDALENDGDGGLVLISNWNTDANSSSSSSGTSQTSFDLSQATGTLSVAHGGTGATSADAARAALGLGDLATENAPLAVDKGGTGATDAEGAVSSLNIKAIVG